MSAVFAALVPVFLVIALGALLSARQVVADDAWDAIERLTFYVLFPSLLIVKIGGAEVPGAELMPLFAALFATTLAVWLAVTVLRRGIPWDGPVYVAAVNGMLRPNSYLGLAAAFALYGDAGLTLAAVGILAVIPLVNVLTVFSHYRFADDDGGAGEGPARRAARNALKNPIIIACLVGAALNLSGLGLPPLVGEALDLLGRGALVMGLLAVGASLDIRALRVAGTPVAVTAAVKLAVMPVLAVVACGLFGVSGLALSVAVVFAALPVSVSAYVIVRQMGGEGELMASIVAVTTLISAAMLPLVVWALGQH